MASPTALRTDDLLDIDKQHTTSPFVLFGLSLLFGVATFLATIPGGGVWVVAGLGLALVAITAWWVRLRAEGKRFNNYDPAKSADDLARTPGNSPEQQRLIFLQIVVLALVFGGALFPIPNYPLLAGVAVFILSLLILFTTKNSRLAITPLPELIQPGARVQSSSREEWLLAFLYAHRIATGGSQWRNDALTEAAERYDFPAQHMSKTLSALQKQGLIEKIRELRSTDGSLVWITLTDRGVEAAARVLQR